MSEIPLVNQEIESSPSDIAEECFNYFLETVCKPNEQGAVPDEVTRAATESILLLHSGELSSSNHSSDPRDKAVWKIKAEHAGMPKSRAEVSDILEGPKRKFDKAVRLKRGRRSTYSRIDGFREDALKDAKALSRIMTVTDEGKIIPNVSQFRQNLDAIFTVGDYLQARDSLNRMEWPAKNTHDYKNSQKYWRGCAVAAARFGGPSTTAIIVNDAREHASDRLRYLTEQIKQIGKTVGGRAVRTAIETANNPERDDTESETEDVQFKSDQTGKGASLASYIPGHVHDHLVAKYAHKAAKIETQVRQGTPRHVAELRVLGAPAVYDKTGNLMGLADTVEDDQPSAAAVVIADTREMPNAALKPGIRRLPGYDQNDDPSNPWHY